MDELQAYAELVSLGSPDFIEVKVSSAPGGGHAAAQAAEGWGKLSDTLGLWVTDSLGSWLLLGVRDSHAEGDRAVALRKLLFCGAGEMAQCVSAVAAFPKDPAQGAL